MFYFGSSFTLQNFALVASIKINCQWLNDGSKKFFFAVHIYSPQHVSTNTPIQRVYHLKKHVYNSKHKVYKKL